MKTNADDIKNWTIRDLVVKAQELLEEATKRSEEYGYKIMGYRKT